MKKTELSVKEIQDIAVVVVGCLDKESRMDEYVRLIVKFDKLIPEPILPGSDEDFDETIYKDFDETYAKYEKHGFEIPWVDYSFKNEQGEVVGYGGFSEPVKDAKVEIDKATYNPMVSDETQAAIYAELVAIAYKAQECITVFARTTQYDTDAPEVLRKCGFRIWHYPDEVFDDILWIHEKDKFVPNRQALFQVEQALFQVVQSLKEAKGLLEQVEHLPQNV